MGLGAGRTELDISLTGEDETRKMLEDAKKRMKALEDQLRGLTDASRDNEDATDDSRGALERFNGGLGGLAEGIEGPIDGMDKLFGAIGKVTGVFGSLSEIVQGAIEVYKFFTEESEEAKKATEKLKEQMKALEEQGKATREAVDALREAQKASVTEERDLQSQILQEQLRQAQLLKQDKEAARIQAQIDYKAEVDRVQDLKAKRDELGTQSSDAHAQLLAAEGARKNAEMQIADLQGKQFKEKKKIAELERKLGKDTETRGFATKVLNFGEGELAKRKAKVRDLGNQIYTIEEALLKPEKARETIAKNLYDTLLKQLNAMRLMAGLAENTKELVGAAGDAAAEIKPTGGGGKSKAEREKEALEKAEQARDKLKELRIQEMEREDAIKREKDLFVQAEALKERLTAQLAALPTGKYAKAYEDVRKQIETQIKSVNELLASRVEPVTFEQAKAQTAEALKIQLEIQKKREEIRGVLAQLADVPKGKAGKEVQEVRKELEEQLKAIDEVLKARGELDLLGTVNEDKVAEAVKKQTDAYHKLKEGVDNLTGAKEKAAEAERKMREEALKADKKAREELEKQKRAMPLKEVESYKNGINQLSQMAVPTFADIAKVVDQVATQMGKYKDGQTGLAAAVGASASSIAGAVAQQIGGVKAEAGIRAIYETAMGFATMFSNPAQSVGHFTAAAMFGLVAGGVVKTGPGGQKPPTEKPASATTGSSASGGGGAITNVYNLQTGVVDGQGTARAFRRAEQQARNTGMASAGGW
jgi:DNA repair exonuclease SbcCD ATPase subunit